MIKLADGHGLPIFVVVALQTVLPQAAMVMILMAGDAGRRDSQVSFAEVFDLDGCALTRRDVLWTMAFHTS